MRFIFKICQNVAGTSKLRYFHEFFKTSFWRGFFQLFQQIYIASVSSPCVRCLYKICQIVAGTSKMRHFHEFFKPSFWRVFSNCSSCEAESSLGLAATSTSTAGNELVNIKDFYGFNMIMVDLNLHLSNDEKLGARSL